MTENFLTTIALSESTGSPAGLLAGPYQVQGTNALVRTEAISTLTRKDPWRATKESTPLLAAPGFAWACDVGDGQASDVILDAIGDPGRSEEAGNLRTWRVGRASEARRFDFHADAVGGGDILVQNAALVSAQLVIERGAIANWTTNWAGRSIAAEDPAWTVEELQNTEYATAVTTTITIDDEELRIFSAAIQIDRRIRAANFGEDGIARNWAGSPAFDVVGRVALRLEASDFLGAMTGQILERAIAITMVAGDRTRTLTLAKCACEIPDHRLIGQGTYEHLMDFAVIREEGQDVLTITSETP